MPITTSIGMSMREQASISLRRIVSLVAGPAAPWVERVLRRPCARVLTRLATALLRSAQAMGECPGAGSHTWRVIKADVSITTRQRQMLIDIYKSFHKEDHAKAALARAAHRGRPARRGGASPLERPYRTRYKEKWPMTLSKEVKRIAESKPFCAVAGAGGYAADQWRKMRSRNVPATARTLPSKTAETITRDLPAKARNYLDTAVDRVAKVYDDLAVRGREIVSTFSREAAHELEEVSAVARRQPAPAGRAPGRRRESVVKPSPAGAPVRKGRKSVVQPSPIGSPAKETEKAGTSRTRSKTGRKT
ncbi:hypothetical protein OHA25_42085 [Nonomuraea sp. NBC_00507]|uniref:hypothetical protein n=1 Tax=Nonomuraea sp. NBC_00507 TaxID=2976002 RepID=UPI002E18B8CE